MLKGLICFLGLYSSAYTATNIPKTLDAVTDAPEVLRDAVLREATILSEITGSIIDTPDVPKVEINIEPVPQGKWMKDTPKYVVVSALPSPQDIKFEHVFIWLDGRITCFVPSDAQLANLDKFSEGEREIVINEKNNFINLLDKNYDNLADYLINSHYAIERPKFISAWGGVRSCDDFSINITLQRMIKKFNSQLEIKDGYANENLYQDYQIDVVHNILQALTCRGISKKNILGLSDIALSAVHIAPYTPFWRQFYERHDGFFDVLKFSTTYKIKDARELENALLKIGYTNPIDPETHEKCIGEDCWVRRAVNAFILHYLPKEKFKFNGLDRDVVTAEVAYDEGSAAFEKSIFEFLNDNNNKKIFNYIVENSRRSVTNLRELSDALVELGYEKEEVERENRIIARAVNNVSRHLFEHLDYHQHTFIYQPEGTCYSKEQTYNMLKNEHPEILSAIEQIANI